MIYRDADAPQDRDAERRADPVAAACLARCDGGHVGSSQPWWYERWCSGYGRAGSSATWMLRHRPWRNRATLNAQRVMGPNKIAIQMSAGRRPRVAWNRAQTPRGPTTWDTIEMHHGERV